MTGVDIVICCYTEDRWNDIVAGIAASRDQTLPPSSVIVVVDHNDELFGRLRAQVDGTTGVGVFVVRNQFTQGLSGARNTAIEHSNAEIVAFLDDDACPQRTWLQRLVEPFADPGVWVTGGHVSPRWPTARPAWFPPEFDWVIGCTYRGMPTVTSEVRNVHGASMAFRHAAFDTVGGFVEGVGRVGTVPKGCEETELCIRIAQAIPEAKVVYVADSDVSHLVTPARTRPAYFRSRCWAEGLSKAAIAGMVDGRAATSTEREYVRVTLVRAVTGDVLRSLRGDGAALARAAMVVLGVVWTAAGYAVGLFASRVRRRRTA